MAKYLEIGKTLLTKFKAVKIEQVGKDLNLHAGALASLTLVFKGKLGQTIAVDLISALNHDMSQESILVNTKLGPSWIDPIVNFI